jgi:acyl-CoA reductase-like NAD-dependent aldehyde dehydrogenase
LNREAELKTINPATEEIINTYKIMTKEQISEKVKKAQNRFIVAKNLANKFIEKFVQKAET